MFFTLSWTVLVLWSIIIVIITNNRWCVLSCQVSAQLRFTWISSPHSVTAADSSCSLSLSLSVQTVDPRCFDSSGTLPHFTVACTHTLTGSLHRPGVVCVCVFFKATFCCHMDVEWFSMSAWQAHEHTHSNGPTQREFLRQRDKAAFHTPRYSIRLDWLCTPFSVRALCVLSTTTYISIAPNFFGTLAANWRFLSVVLFKNTEFTKTYCKKCMGGVIFNI